MLQGLITAHEEKIFEWLGSMEHFDQDQINFVIKRIEDLKKIHLSDNNTHSIAELSNRLKVMITKAFCGWEAVDRLEGDDLESDKKSLDEIFSKFSVKNTMMKEFVKENFSGFSDGG